MNKILVPVDGSVHSLKALHVGCDLAEKYNGSVSLLHVLSENRSAQELVELAVFSSLTPKLKAVLQQAAASSSGPVPLPVLETVGEKILDEATARVTRRGLETHVLEISKGNPAEDIINAYKRIGANTIVMGCRGGNANGPSSIGSVSSAVIQTVECTCILVK